ncbi:cell division protein ZapE [Nocardia sp. NPDC058176]|uniref:cell division protein ZapE n=1 Tax=Nocardia sp. NPDC058176 TaxID=3346368 RepID=UPI0036DC8BBE
MNPETLILDPAQVTASNALASLLDQNGRPPARPTGAQRLDPHGRPLEHRSRPTFLGRCGRQLGSLFGRPDPPDDRRPPLSDLPGDGRPSAPDPPRGRRSWVLGSPPTRRRGVYLHGRPGRGKTMVMDRFFVSVDSERKRRFHFHAFFADLHATTHTLGSIERAVDALLGDAELICFDEFHVNDIGDAMLIARLIDTLFADRRTLVVTSNHPPADLLPNPLFHDRFVPTIDQILSNLTVVSLDGPVDYRTLGPRRDHGFATGNYILDPPEHAAADPRRRDPSASRITLADGRTVRTHAVEGDAITFGFEDLCGAPTSAADYLHLTRGFRRWTLRAVPPLREVPTDWTMRLVNLVDILYDADLPLTIHAAEPVDELTAGVQAIPDLARTASRLCELSQVAAKNIRTAQQGG